MKQTGATEFVEENFKTIFAYALSQVSNKGDAENLPHDIVLAILQSADKIRNPDAFTDIFGELPPIPTISLCCGKIVFMGANRGYRIR